ncbi:MAG TPA: hypothetical protein VM367_14260 [Pseudonocardia sp.]|nr:hypothetical protein [Pseudonocardia sp.]
MIEGRDEMYGNEPFVVRDPARSEVLHRHARLSRKGRPVFCTPSRAERSGSTIPRQGPGTDGKVIYPTRDAAEAAARELEDLGSRTLRAYLCGRSRGGHYHLATDTSGRVHHRPLAERIPAQRGVAHPRVGVPVQRSAPPCPVPPCPVPLPSDLFARIPQQRRPLSA